MQLDALEDYLASAASPTLAAQYVDAIIRHCEGLSTFPLRGNCRDDLMPGLRITHYRHSTIIAFIAEPKTATVSILGVFYGGQDYDSHWRQEHDE
ncbi:plasmid stabilization system protein [Pseudomonas asplenii]|uniref:Plasmid stabilization system protein n=2 Tax=Pseudomonas asplenii TaxID=53407 RepID=A0A0M9GIE9_9PSED|nr:plasmid stabilization system protein [Pseudomonas fuscovaginae]